MAKQYEVTDTQWEIIKSYLGNISKKTGRPQSYNQKILNGILWILHTGAPWRDLPEYYDSWENREYIADHDAGIVIIHTIRKGILSSAFL